MSSPSSAELLDFAHGLLDETDQLALAHFGGKVAVTRKADQTPVTAADTAVEELVRRRIGNEFPGHGVLGEEFGEEPPTGDARWIVDPIDGTYNFARGIPIFATLLALEVAGRLVLGAVSAPALGRRWTATDGGGAWLRWGGSERRLEVSGVDDLESAQLCHSSMRGLDEAGLLAAWRELAGRSARDRGFGDFWGHMLVAEGAAEAMLEYGLRPWDVAALKVIVTEAGGRLTDLEGRDAWSGPAVLTSNGLLHDQLLAQLYVPG